MKTTPACCKNCKRYDWDTTDPDGYGTVYSFCEKGIFMPVKKGTCKKQEKLKGGVK